MGRPAGKPAKTPARAKRVSNERAGDAVVHAAGHGPYATRPQLGTLLVIEESASLPPLTGESLVDAGFVLVRAATVEQGVALFNSVQVDGFIVCVGPEASDVWLRAGVDVLAQVPVSPTLPIAVVVRGELTADERRVVLRHNAEIVGATALRHASVRNHLIKQLLGRLRPSVADA